MGADKEEFQVEFVRMRAFVFVALALLVVVALGEETYSKSELSKMSKDELMTALMKTQKTSLRTRSELESARKQIRTLHTKMTQGRKVSHFSEKNREVNEAKHKAQEKKAAAAKKKAKLAKKEKLSDILMDHGAKFLALKAAKEYKDEHSDKQRKKVLAAARKGGRAGSVGPLRKVARAAAVAAVKKTRASLKKKGKHLSKHKLRHLCLNAAKVAVKAVLKEQDTLIEKAAQKWLKVATKKYPAAILVSEHPNKPNVFKAPPMVHLSLNGSPPAAPKEVKPLKKAKKVVKKTKKVVKNARKVGKALKPKVKKVAKKTKKVVKKVMKKPKKAVKKVVQKAKAKIVRAAAKAKAKAGKVVPEKH